MQGKGLGHVVKKLHGVLGLCAKSKPCIKSGPSVFVRYGAIIQFWPVECHQKCYVPSSGRDLKKPFAPPYFLLPLLLAGGMQL